MPYTCERYIHPPYSPGYQTAVSTMCSPVCKPSLLVAARELGRSPRVAPGCGLTFLHAPGFQHFQGSELSDQSTTGKLLHVIPSFKRGQKWRLCSHSWYEPSPVISWPLTNLIWVEFGPQAATKYNHVIQCSIPSKYAFSNLLIPGIHSTFHKEPQTSCKLFHHTRS